jgi:nitrile hydratase
VGPRNGAHVVAKAWTDPEFAAWLKRDATAAIASLGYMGRQGEHMQAVFNTPDTHNLIVCTLCSCYPWTVLGVPPTWYKAPPYRSQAVINPRGVLAEFGLELPETIRIRVWDSTAELRYMVVPMRPAWHRIDERNAPGGSRHPGFDDRNRSAAQSGRSGI